TRIFDRPSSFFKIAKVLVQSLHFPSELYLVLDLVVSIRFTASPAIRLQQPQSWCRNCPLGCTYPCWTSYTVRLTKRARGDDCMAQLPTNPHKIAVVVDHDILLETCDRGDRRVNE
ncbi:unnamed protein product, partial [Fusarium graminearum]